MTPADRKECVAMLRTSAQFEAIDADKFNDEANHQAHCEVVGCRHGKGEPPDLVYAAECRGHAWHLAARANLLAAAADEIERAGATALTNLTLPNNPDIHLSTDSGSGLQRP